MVEDYRDLIVWRRSIELVACAYRLQHRLPREERYALADQIRRAAVSVPANIAEGNARQHVREYLQSACIARGSLAELDTLIDTALVVEYVSENEVEEFRRLQGETARLLQGLINSLRRKVDGRANRSGR